MRKIKNLVVSAIIASMAFSLMGCELIAKTPEAIANTVLAKVGDDEITLGEVDNEIKSDIDGLKEQYGEDFESKIDPELKEQLKQVRLQVVDMLIEEKILLLKEEEFGIAMSQEELDKEIEERVEALIEQYGGEEELEEAKEYYGYTDETFKTFLEDQVKAQNVIDEITKEITVTDKEVEEYYEEHKDEFVNYGKADTRHLLFKTEEEAELASKKIENGEVTFDQLFEEYKDNKEKAMAEDASEEDKKLPIAEDLEEVSHGEPMFDPDFLEGLKPLKDGEISKPVESSFGFHIIEAKNVEETTDMDFDDELKEQIKEDLELEQKSELYVEKLEEYKEEFDVKLYENRLD